MPVDFSGMYYDVGMTLENRPVFFDANTTAASESVMYWTGGVSIATGEEPDFGRRRHLTNNNAQPRADGADSGGDTLALPARGKEGSVAARKEGDRALAACDTGGWVLRESGGGYPAYMVFDCASHPVDISSGVWYRIPSRDDSAETMDASFSVVCLEPENDDGPSPASSDMTNSPAVEVVGFATVAPGASVEVEDVFDRGTSSSSPGANDPLGWLASTSGLSSSSRGGLTSSGGSGEGGVIGQANAESDDSGVVTGLLVSSGIFVVVVAGAVILWNIVHRRKQSPSRRNVVPATNATNVAAGTASGGSGGGEEKTANVEDAVAVDIGTTADEKEGELEGGYGLDADPKRWLPGQPQDNEQGPAAVAGNKPE
ncbi:unnamed protein product [Ectocarpus fasciculatus]